MSRLITRGTGVESPTNTFTITTSEEQEIATGLDNVVIGINTDGSFTADLIFNFVGSGSAADFPNDTEWVKFCGDYTELTENLTPAVGSEILDVLFFADADEFDAFVAQLRADFSLQIKLKGNLAPTPPAGDTQNFTPFGGGVSFSSGDNIYDSIGCSGFGEESQGSSAYPMVFNSEAEALNFKDNATSFTLDGTDYLTELKAATSPFGGILRITLSPNLLTDGVESTITWEL